MTADLSALIARLEAADVGSRELDAEIWDIEDDRTRFDLGDGVAIYKRDPDDHVAFDAPPPYTASLDAALALAERVLPGRRVAIVAGHNPAAVVAERPGESWHIGDDLDDSWSTKASTPALALCIAILRAKQGEGE